MRAHILGVLILICVSLTNGRKVVEVNSLTANTKGSDLDKGDISLTILGWMSGPSCNTGILDNQKVDDFELGVLDRFVGNQLGQCNEQDFTDVGGIIVRHTDTNDDWIFEFIRLLFDDRTYVDCGEPGQPTSINGDTTVFITCN